MATITALSETSICCSKCGIVKPVEAYHVRKDLQSGYLASCKKCANELRRKYRQENSELVRIQKQASYKRNRKKVLAKNKQWRINNPEKVKECNRRAYQKRKPRMKDLNLQRLYNISLIDFNEMFIIQNGKCAICGCHQSEMTKSLHVDHNHETGQVRGLLCSGCNTALGSFADDVKLLKRAIAYLEKYHGIYSSS